MFKNKKVISILLVGICVIFLAACSNSNSDSSIPSIGENIILSDNVLCGTSKDNLDKALSFISEKNSEGLDGMLSSGEAFEFSKGTKINIIGAKSASFEIEDNNGKSGYTIMEAVK
ncbi:hypothetical protein [Clostridium lacusfryxellense]|uniref:hypothetical protein n=1 Tax=Clostridium lacusfryxellense TaxID=205328 RepID=UPI001C0E60B3|nr:hypothetical protein [Clostridium lacusfryxellense]MBU3114339.1 hypothetical protein [Clostridium lacusfryxellense]